MKRVGEANTQNVVNLYHTFVTMAARAASFPTLPVSLFGGSRFFSQFSALLQTPFCHTLNIGNALTMEPIARRAEYSMPQLLNTI